MSNFDDRQKSFEAEFAHDAALQFKTEARRNKLFGLWLAARMGKTGSEAEDYAKEVVIADMEEPGDEDVIRKVMGDIEAGNLAVSEEDVRAKLQEFMATAFDQVKSGIR